MFFKNICQQFSEVGSLCHEVKLIIAAVDKSLGRLALHIYVVIMSSLRKNYDVCLK